MTPGIEALRAKLAGVPADARKLFCVIVEQATRGPLHPKAPGVATPLEILEACGLGVGDFYDLLAELQRCSLIEVSGDYPFEEIRLTPEAAPAVERAKQGGSLPDLLA